MKKISITQLPVFLLLLALITASCSKNLVPYAPKPNTIAMDNNEGSEPVSRTQVSIRAARSFYEFYGEEQVAAWFRTPEGFMVSFEKDGVKTLIHYTHSGFEESRIKFYFEEKLPPTVRHIVRSNFYDYAISHITEVQKNDATAFYVQIQDSTTIKTIKIVDGDWEITEDLAKR